MNFVDEQPSKIPGLGRAMVGVGQGQDRLGSGDRSSSFLEVPKNPQRALHLSGSEGVGKTCPLFF